MIKFLRVGRTPRSFAASMAGLRQELALLHPPGSPKSNTFWGGSQGRNEEEDGADRSFLVPRGMRLWGPRRASDGVQSRGRNLGRTVAAKGKRRSRPLPTKAIDEALGERSFGQSYTKEVWQGLGHAFNVWLTGSVRNWYVGLAEPRRIPCRCCCGRQRSVAPDFCVCADRAAGRKCPCRP
jgi:hypothetical protein